MSSFFLLPPSPFSSPSPPSLPAIFTERFCDVLGSEKLVCVVPYVQLGTLCAEICVEKEQTSVNTGLSPCRCCERLLAFLGVV